ncbi:MAG TPA: PKD domain-containing protein, partial [Conexibacter sp.]|nr:PKD domain-containing protein [Conexibacter sp.]
MTFPPIWITDFPGTLTPVQETGVVGPAIGATDGAYDVVVTPDGNRAYVSHRDTNTRAIVPIDLTTGAIGSAIPIPGNEVAMAMGPGGKTVYVTTDNGILVLIDTATGTVRSQLSMEGRTPDLAILPNGATAFVIVNDGVVPVDTRTLKPSLRIPVFAGLQSITMIPDGTSFYVASSDQIAAIPTGPRTTYPVTQLGGTTSSIVATPDGRLVLAVVGTTVVPIDVAAFKPGTPVQIGADPQRIFTTQDAAFIPLADSHEISSVLWSPSGRLTLGRDLVIPGQVNDATATADQAPVARLAVTVAPAGRATIFDATASTTRYGAFRQFVWDFGDGARTTIVSVPGRPYYPRHVYAKPGTYTVSVTAVNSQGTSPAK